MKMTRSALIAVCVLLTEFASQKRAEGMSITQAAMRWREMAVTGAFICSSDGFMSMIKYNKDAKYCASVA